MFCPVCRRKASDDSSFCEGCGASLRGEAAGESFVPNPNEPQANYPANQNSQNQFGPQSPQSSRPSQISPDYRQNEGSSLSGEKVSHTPKIAVLIAATFLLIAGIGILAYFIFGNSDNSSDRSSTAETVRVPDVEGLERAEAIDILKEAGFLVREVRKRSEDVMSGICIGTEPKKGSRAEKGSALKLLVSTGIRENSNQPVADILPDPSAGSGAYYICPDCDGYGGWYMETWACGNCNGWGAVYTGNTVCRGCSGQGGWHSGGSCATCGGSGGRYEDRGSVICSRCGGEGGYLGDYTACPYCYGTGYDDYGYYCDYCLGNGIVQEFYTCSDCGGTGTVHGGSYWQSCALCGGSGSSTGGWVFCDLCQGTGFEGGYETVCPTCRGEGSRWDWYSCRKCRGAGWVKR